MPIDRSRYPADWEAITRRIRERDGHRCRGCGVKRGTRAVHADGREYRIGLTVVHLNHDIGNNSERNLALLCPDCLHGPSAPAIRRRVLEYVRRANLPMGDEP